MTEPTNPDSSSPIQGPDSSSQPSPTGEPTYKKGDIEAKPMTFLGMYFNADQAKKLWQIITQNLASAINKDKAKALKALRKLRAGHEND